jgi:YD repeat-containing protein
MQIISSIKVRYNSRFQSDLYMKYRLLPALALSLVLFLTHWSAALGQTLQSHPAARSPLFLRDRFDTDLFTGGAVYSYPLNVPKGTNDLTPAVSLNYNSLGARDFNTYAGMGWQLDRNYIERDVNYTPGNTGDDKFKLHFNGSVSDLVFVPTENKFHTKTESYLHIQRLPGGQNQFGDYWQVTTPDGTKYRFGYQHQSELMCNGQNHVLHWNLDQVEDTHGNKMFYTYSESSGASYLTKIEYNTEKSRAVEFVYTPSTYHRQVSNQGCFVVETSKLSTVKVKQTKSSNGFTDTTSNGNHLTNIGGASYTVDTPFSASTHAYDVESTESNYATAPDSPSLSITGDITIEGWIKPESQPSDSRMRIAAKNQAYYFGYSKIGTYRLELFIIDPDGVNYDELLIQDTNPIIPTGTWAHVAVTWKAATKTAKFYVNGVQVGSDQVGTRGVLVDSAGSLDIGRSSSGSYFDGAIDEVRIWHTVRTATDLTNNKSTELTGSESGLAAYYQFDNLVESPLVRTYALTYTATGNEQPLLQTITENGSDGSSLPATTFAYTPATMPVQVTAEHWIDNATLDADLSQPNITFADVNGDGLLDIVKTEQNGAFSHWDVSFNQGNSWSTTFVRYGNNLPEAYGLNSNEMRLIDVTGDNLPDIVRSTAGTVGGRSTWDVWRNTGSSWQTLPERWVNNDFIDANLSWPTTQFADVNGDGLVDIIRSHTDTNAPPNWKVYKNTGSTWHTSYENWLAPRGLDFSNSNVRLTDVNGDSLPDIVRTTFSGTTATWEVYKNNGYSWTPAIEHWISNATIDAHLAKDTVTLMDVTGDGLPDIVRGTDNFGAADTWEVLVNLGNRWATSWQTWIASSSNVEIDTRWVRVADATGDGIGEVISGRPVGDGRVNFVVFRHNTPAPQHLAKITTSQGGSISFDYTPSTKFDNTGSDDLPDLPFPLWLVGKMTVNNGMTTQQQTTDTTTYSYQNGFYKWQDKEFRGFGTIDEVLPSTARKKHVFHQDDAFKGRYLELQSRDNQQNPFAETEYTWGSTTNNGIFTVTLTQEKQYTYDGTVENPKVVQTEYRYDGFGNVTKKAERGDTAVTGDERFTSNEYTVNPTAWILNTVKHTFVNKADDQTKVSERWFTYDNHLGIDEPPTKGDLTKEVTWLNTQGASNPMTQYSYDSFGNQTSVIDANTHTTTTAFDTTGTYPVSTTNAKTQTATTTYDLGTGNLLAKTDPNGFATSYTYDTFGRLTKEIKPYDTSSFPTTTYTYFTDGIAPEGTLVAKREVSGAAGTLDTYTWIDGSGRTIQTREESETTGQQIVTNTFYDPTGNVLKETVPALAPHSTTY